MGIDGALLKAPSEGVHFLKKFTGCVIFIKKGGDICEKKFIKMAAKKMF